MKRTFAYITIGKILDDYNALLKLGVPKMARITLYRFIRTYQLPGWDNKPPEWRKYSIAEANQIMDKLKKKNKVEQHVNFVVRFIGGFTR